MIPPHHHFLLSALLLLTCSASASAAAAAAPNTKPNNPTFYSNTWSGPAQLLTLQQDASSSSSSSPFSSIEAILIIPHLELPANPEEVVDQYSASFWVGIDGYNSNDRSSRTVVESGLWQVGVIGHVLPGAGKDGSGQGVRREWVAFWEWFPEPEHFLPTHEFPVLEGQHISLSANVSRDGTLGTAFLKNLNTTKSIGTTRSAPIRRTSQTGQQQQYITPGNSAEWIVESGTYPNNTRQILPDFGEVVFRDARAWRRDGSVVLPGDDNEEGGLQVFENFGEGSGRLYTRTEVEGIPEVRIGYIEEECGGCGVECERVGSCFQEEGGDLREKKRGGV